jgi:hypothetical protein
MNTGKTFIFNFCFFYLYIYFSNNFNSSEFKLCFCHPKKHQLSRHSHSELGRLSNRTGSFFLQDFAQNPYYFFFLRFNSAEEYKKKVSPASAIAKINNPNTITANNTINTINKVLSGKLSGIATALIFFFFS